MTIKYKAGLLAHDSSFKTPSHPKAMAVVLSSSITVEEAARDFHPSSLLMFKQIFFILKFYLNNPILTLVVYYIHCINNL